MLLEAFSDRSSAGDFKIFSMQQNSIGRVTRMIIYDQRVSIQSAEACSIRIPEGDGDAGALIIWTSLGLSVGGKIHGVLLLVQ
jgi:hypothetical protein